MPLQITVAASSDPIHIRLVGAVDADSGARLEAEVVAGLKGRATPRVIVDLSALDGANIVTRRALVGMQGHLRAMQARTAYLCNSPLLRGLALSVGHLAEDEGVKAVMNEEQALAWLDSTDGRFARADRVVSGGGR